MKSLKEYKEYLLLEAFEVYETNEGDKILVPRFKPKNTNHRVFKDWPVGKNFGYNQQILYDAIQWGMILEMTYEKDGVKTKRTIQPMVLGKNADDENLLRAFHLKGNSKSLGKNTKKVWRLFKTANIEELSFTGSFFRTAESNYNESDSAMKGGIITAADIKDIRDNQEKLVNEAFKLGLIELL